MLNRFLRQIIPLLLLMMLLSTPFRGLRSGQRFSSGSKCRCRVAWMDLTYRLVQSEPVDAPEASRIYAYAGVTLYEAVVNGMPNNSSLASSLNSMPDMPLPAADQVTIGPRSPTARWRKCCPHLFLHPSEDTRQAISDLRAEQIDLRKAVADPDVVAASLKYGSVLADALIDWIGKDGYLDTRDQPYQLPTGSPSDYVPTREDGMLVEPFWGEFALLR